MPGFRVSRLRHAAGLAHWLSCSRRASWPIPHLECRRSVAVASTQAQVLGLSYYHYGRGAASRRSRRRLRWVIISRARRALDMFIARTRRDAVHRRPCARGIGSMAYTRAATGDDGVNTSALSITLRRRQRRGIGACAPTFRSPVEGARGAYHAQSTAMRRSPAGYRRRWAARRSLRGADISPSPPPTRRCRYARQERFRAYRAGGAAAGLKMLGDAAVALAPSRRSTTPRAGTAMLRPPEESGGGARALFASCHARRRARRSISSMPKSGISIFSSRRHYATPRWR